jgi:hypothetical protein
MKTKVISLGIISAALFTATLAQAQFGGQVGSTFGGSIGGLVVVALLIFALVVVWNVILAVFQWLARVLKTLFKRT